MRARPRPVLLKLWVATNNDNEQWKKYNAQPSKIKVNPKEVVVPLSSSSKKSQEID